MESQIARCAEEIDRLQIEYGLFFAGERKLPPEKLRAKVEHDVHTMLMSETKAPHLNLKIQNVASTFTLYNNLWLKRLNEIESGVVNRAGKKTDAPPAAAPPSSEGEIRISLNDEDTFDKLYDYYQQMAATNSLKPNAKEKVINSIKSKMIINNLVETDLTVAILKGKISLKIKKISGG